MLDLKKNQPSGKHDLSDVVRGNLRQKQPQPALGRPATFFLALGIIVTILLSTRSSQADFELPLIDTNNYVATDFRGIFGFYRSNWDGVNPTNIWENYEAWAVGEYSDSGITAGAIYRLSPARPPETGLKWQQTLPLLGTVPAGVQPPFTAVGGQYDIGAGYSEMWVANYGSFAGPPQAKLFSTHGSGAETLPETIGQRLTQTEGEAQILGLADGICLPSKRCQSKADDPNILYPEAACLDNRDCPRSQTLSNPIYAINGAQTYGGHLFAGGQNGLLLVHSGFSSGGFINDGANNCPLSGFCKYNSSQACVNDPPGSPIHFSNVCLRNPVPDRWTSSPILSGGSVPGFAATDDITGIAYVNYDTAYVTTADFAAGVHPYDRTCAGTETGKLFRVIGDPAAAGSWKQVAQRANTCFFGLAAGSVDLTVTQTSVNNGPLRNYIWIAAADGVYRVTDSDFRTTAAVQAVGAPVYGGSAFYGITASRNLGGDGANQLMNGEFNSCLFTGGLNSCAVLPGQNVNPDHWQLVGQNSLERRGASCGVAEAQQDIVFVDGSSSPDASLISPDYAIQIQPGQGMTDCSGGGSAANHRTADAFDGGAVADRPVLHIEYSQNNAPAVEAGANATIIQPASSFNLDGSVWDDGLPTGGTLTTTWSQTGGPAVTYNASALDQTITLASTGTYTFQLTASDGKLSATPDIIQITVQAAGGAPTSIDEIIAAGSDDAEQGADDVMNMSSSDLELAWDLSPVLNQRVGLRFTTVPIPIGSTISSAYVQFRADEADSGTAPNLTIRGQAAANPVTFSSTNNIISRPLTTASVAWSPPAWPTVNESAAAQRTPEIRTIIQEIVNQAGWAQNNALVLIINGDGGGSGTIQRVADPYEDAAGRPRLHVDFTTGPVNTAPAVTAGPTQTIYPLTATATLDGAASDDGLPSGTLTTTWTKQAGPPGAVVFGDPNALDTTATFPAVGVYTLRLTANDGALNSFSDLTVNVLAAAPVLTIDEQVPASSDDAEENSAGAVTLISPDLQLIYDTSNQNVGLRFTTLAINPGSVINVAYVQFRADEVQSGPTNVVIKGQAADSATTFLGALNNISSRPRTTAAVPWSPPAWNTVGEVAVAQRTPELKTIIQEVINRAGWANNNAVALIVTGEPLPIDTATNAVGATSAVNRVSLTAVEGKKYQITGKYKVEFSDIGPAGAIPPNAFGGVQVACAGANPPGGSVNCSMGTTRYLHNPAGGNTGWRTIDHIVSRQDTQLAPPIQGSISGNTGAGLVLEIRCVATFGAKVTCDDLHVSEVNDPTVNQHGSYLVAAVGQGGLAVVSEHGSDGLPVFTAESNPFIGTDAIAITAVDPGHIYAVGLGGAIAQRSAGNISGYLVAGTAAPGDSGGDPAINGWISMNCASNPVVIQATGRSLCQQTASTYGVNYNPASRAITGRAWYGKLVKADSVKDEETVNLGACVRPGRKPLSGPADNPYDMTGSCDSTTRTCVGDPTKVCMQDVSEKAFDCYGRCAGDSGFLCLVDEDCQVGGAPHPIGSPSLSGTPLDTFPKFRIQCDANNASPLACTSAGWLTFNPSEFSPLAVPPALETGAGQRNNCPGGGVCIDAQNNVRGVAQFMTLARSGDPELQAKSWLSFRGGPAAVGTNLYGCKSCSPAGPNELNCNYCQDDNNYSCNPAPDPPVPDPVNYPYTCHFYCGGFRGPSSGRPCPGGDNDCPNIAETCQAGTCQAKICLDTAQCRNGTTCRAAGWCSQKNSTGNLMACTNSNDCAPDYGSCIVGADCDPSGATCAQYGLNFDDATGRFRGYAWSPVYGWLGSSGLSQGSARFIQTRLGDIYATGQIGAEDVNAAPITQCNATYLISSASDIVNFCSNFLTGAGIPTRATGVAPIPFASPGNVFTNVLGRFDLTGMTTPAGPGGNNKYGSQIRLPNTGQQSLSIGPPDAQGRCEIHDTNAAFDMNPGPIKLDGQVYMANEAGCNTYILSPSLPSTFANICGNPFKNAAGLLVVKGNLEIHNNLSYGGCGVIDDLRRLASLVVYVEGDLIIQNHVTNLVGTYYVQDTVRTSKEPNINNSFPLTVRGLMIAKSFEFGRQFAGTIDNPLPSELVIYDGRIQSNPLPGMVDFAGALPNTVNTGP